MYTPRRSSDSDVYLTLFVYFRFELRASHLLNICSTTKLHFKNGRAMDG
jgi:hypothetical protein